MLFTLSKNELEMKFSQYMEQFIPYGEKQITVKIHHSFDVADASVAVAQTLNMFNEEALKLLYRDALLHDIGRGAQLKYSGTFRDFDSFKGGKLVTDHRIYGHIHDHGHLGRAILQKDGYLKSFVPETRIFDRHIESVVGYHVNPSLPNHLSSPINVKEKLFLDYSMEELFTSSKISKKDKLKLAGWFIRIVQDVDKLDILKQVVRGDFNPTLSFAPEDNIPFGVYDLFKDGKYFDMNLLKSNGLWTCNVGQLVRWSFIYNLNLVNTVKEVQNSNLIQEVWEKNPIPTLEEGYEYITKVMDAMLKTSPDGIYTDKEAAFQYVKKGI